MGLEDDVDEDSEEVGMKETKEPLVLSEEDTPDVYTPPTNDRF